MPQSPHDTLPELSPQLHDLIREGWEQEVLSQLPADYEQQARRTGAFVRARGLTCAADLLRGLLAYVLCAPSFRQLGAWALLIGLANLSHVAWHKRLRQARSWLLWLLMQCLAIPSRPVPVAMKRIVLIDATRLKEPGGTGDDWRVHLGYDLLAGRLLDVKVSDGHTAEGFTLFALQAGDLDLCSPAQVPAVPAPLSLQSQAAARPSGEHHPPSIPCPSRVGNFSLFSLLLFKCLS